MSKSKELREFDRGSKVGCHLCGKSVRSETAEKRTGTPKILGERSSRTLKRVVKQNRKSSSVEISQEFQSSSEISVSSRTVHREFKNLGFHGLAAAHKPYITPQNVKHRLQWCRTHHHWTVTCGKLFFGVMNLALQSRSWMDASGFGECPANVSLVTALCRLLSLGVEAQWCGDVSLDLAWVS
ncbi:uncharacterized protein TNCV_4926791 [Trichonephila clavipes]|nr:uncharacterized protein TNCV_4926791 [Trichonephila clavipes]